MAEGPFGVPRPFASEDCKLVYVAQAIGMPKKEDAAEELNELSRRLAQDTAIPAKDRTIFIQQGRKANNRNTFTVIIGMDSGASVSKLQDWADKIERQVSKVDTGFGTGPDVRLQKYVAGSPSAFASGQENPFSFKV